MIIEEKNMEQSLDKKNGTQIDIPPILYHYTTLEGFLGIIKHKNMWASHILFMNDRSEFNHALKEFETVVRKLRQGRKIKYKPDIESERNRTKLLYGDIEKEDVYIISLSEKPDDLNMWKKYTDMSPGLCLGLDTAKLRGAISQNDINIRIECAIYDPAEQAEALKEKAKKVEDAMEKSGGNFEYSQNLYDDLLEIAPLIKHCAFKDEKEWRIIIRVPRKDIHFRVKGSVIIPYYEHSISEDAIKNIIIGPCGDGDYVKQSIEFVCSKYCKNIGFDGILNSNLPYR
jgi:hypothetical protein